MKILILQTAFIGDVILAAPLAEAAQLKFSGAEVDFLTIPYSAPALNNNPFLNRVITFEKRGGSGLLNTRKTVSDLKRAKYDLALIPHRSLRSALIARLAGIPQRIGFDKSAGRLLLTTVKTYHEDWHETKRNLSLLDMEDCDISPKIFPGAEEISKADDFLRKCGIDGNFIALAPGSIWNTKRWLEEHYHNLCGLLREKGFPPVILIGSKNERELCRSVAEGMDDYVFIAVGELNPLESGALLKKASLLVANDSAAGHIASAVGTPVISIFGPTTPEFGFAPYGDGNVIVKHPDLYCRPCRIHGSHKCPEKHFRCMKEIEPMTILQKIEEKSEGK